MNENESELETGVERENRDVPTKADWYAYADDGDHATVWAVTRIDETTIDVLKFRCEAGLIDSDGPAREYTVEYDTETDKFALDLADDNPQASVDAARVHFSEEYDA